MNSFVAIDFETANNNYSSICQIGIVCFENGNITKSINQLINPEDYFDGFHIQIHKIKPENVAEMPTFEEYFPELFNILENNIVVHHQPFDKSAFDQACAKYNLIPPTCYWLDNAKIVKRTWIERSQKGYGLKDVAKMLNISFKHHDAEDDARVAGMIFLEACKCNEMTIDEIISSVYERRTYKPKVQTQRLTGVVLKPDPENAENKGSLFFGKKVVISGTYNRWPDRKELAAIMKKLGADIDSSVSDKTNYLIAGEGVGPAKFKKMLSNIEAGNEAAILTELMLLEILDKLDLKLG